MKEILERIEQGELSRDNDEKNAGGFYDVALELVDEPMADLPEKRYAKEQGRYFEMVESIYNALWELYELSKERK